MAVNIQTIKDIKPYLIKELNFLYAEPEISALANIIIKTVFNVSKLRLLAMPESPVRKKQLQKIISICKELKTGKPLQYILGETSFYNCTIMVDSGTLIPRSETEELVDLIIKENKGFRGAILDVGTGTGCIAISLAINLPGTSVTGIDISDRAVALAEENARLNNVSVTFLRSDIFNIDSNSLGKMGIIVSNPPYVRESEKTTMSGNVLDFEPHTALFVPDSDPLIYYNSILKLASHILAPQGKIYFEINEAMGENLLHLLKASAYSGIEIIKDINGRDRIIKGIKNE
jgi:release factor glutamine methyltransferase